MTIDSATWGALALTLTLIGALLTVGAWRRRGAAAGIRGLAWTLVPVAAWLTGMLRLATDVLDSVVTWAARVVFSPVVWVGVIVAGISAALFVTSSLLRARGIGVRQGAPTPRRARGAEPKVGVASSKRKQRPAMETDSDMADIEAILKKHGI
ncbi:MAG: hypothetical protein ABIN79_10105 [Marmoricola sp.]